MPNSTKKESPEYPVSNTGNDLTDEDLRAIYTQSYDMSVYTKEKEYIEKFFPPEQWKSLVEMSGSDPKIGEHLKKHEWFKSIQAIIADKHLGPEERRAQLSTMVDKITSYESMNNDDVSLLQIPTTRMRARHRNLQKVLLENHKSQKNAEKTVDLLVKKEERWLREHGVSVKPQGVMPGMGRKED